MNKDFDFFLYGKPSLPYIKSICLNCSFEETKPDFIYDKISEKKRKNLKKESINNLLQ